MPTLPLTLWPWPNLAPSASVFTCMMLCGVETRPLLPLPWLTTSTWSQGYPVFYCPDPWQGHWAGQGNGGRQWILSVLFFKEKYSLFRAYGNFSECCALFVHLFVTPEYWAARMGPEIAPMLSSEAQLSEGRSRHRLDSKILFEVLSLIPGDGWGRM